MSTLLRVAGLKASGCIDSIVIVRTRLLTASEDWLATARSSTINLHLTYNIQTVVTCGGG